MQGVSIERFLPRREGQLGQLVPVEDRLMDLSRGQALPDQFYRVPHRNRGQDLYRFRQWDPGRPLPARSGRSWEPVTIFLFAGTNSIVPYDLLPWRSRGPCPPVEIHNSSFPREGNLNNGTP